MCDCMEIIKDNLREIRINIKSACEDISSIFGYTKRFSSFSWILFLEKNPSQSDSSTSTGPIL